jgi:hypothetical protein
MMLGSRERQLYDGVHCITECDGGDNLLRQSIQNVHIG